MHSGTRLRSFTEIPISLRRCPTCRQQPSPDIPVKCRIRPITDPVDVPVLDWVEVNVIQMGFKVSVVANGVLPETLLPQVIFAPAILFDFLAGTYQVAGETGLDESYPPGIGSVSRWQRPYCVPMVREYDHCIDSKGQFLANTTNHFP